MTMTTNLAKARQVLRNGGWAEPWTRDADGRMCSPHSEEAHTFSVAAAVAISAGPADDPGAALDLLESLVCPSNVALQRLATDFGEGRLLEITNDDLQTTAHAAVAEGESSGASLHEWLEHDARTPSEVLALFDRALMRAKAMENR